MMDAKNHHLLEIIHSIGWLVDFNKTSYIVAGSFIGGGNQSTRRKPST